MKSLFSHRIIAATLLALSVPCAAKAADPLPSWNETASKQAIVAFVERGTAEGGGPIAVMNARCK